MIKTLTLAAALAIGAALPAAATEVVLLADTFDAEHGGTGAAEYSGFTHWVGANVDLLGPGYFGNLCELAGGSSMCVDLEGSGNGTLATKADYPLGAGTVTMGFDLAGDQRGRSGNGVTVSLVSTFGEVLFSEAFVLDPAADFTHYTRTVHLAGATTAELRFLSTGPADAMGMLLDNVSLVSAPSPVPEPGTLALLAAGLAGVGGVVRRRR